LSAVPAGSYVLAMPTPFMEAVRGHAATSPDRPSLTVGDTTLTRAELVAGVERIAAVFAERGVGTGSWVTIALPNGIEFVQSALAAWLLGATPQPISHRLPALEREAIIALAEPALVVGTQAFDPAEAGGRAVLSAAEIAHAAANPAATRVAAPAVLSPEWKVVTSGGSTGRPKLIVASSPPTRKPSPRSATRCGCSPTDRSWSPGR
jgi:bile acid-coenzyme A ligase